MKVLVTGANGFVGRHLCHGLSKSGHTLVATSRSVPDDFMKGCVRSIRCDLHDLSTTSNPFGGVDAVVHLAARVHSMNPRPDEWAKVRATNVHATRSLATSAQKAGVSRFIFVSSSKVYGENTSMANAVRENDTLRPVGPYAISKAAAETALAEISGKTMHMLILRPPLVYGPRAPGNVERISKALLRGRPLPLENTNNLRSMISVKNFVAAIEASLNSPISSDGIRSYNLADAEELSTTQFVRLLAEGMGCTPRLFKVPPPIIRGLQRTRAKTYVDRLWGSFRLDTTAISEDLQWTPPRAAYAELRETGSSYGTLRSDKT